MSEIAPGQIWECSRGRHVGARLEVIREVVPDWWLVRSLTAKNREKREVYWPDLRSFYRLESRHA